MPAFSFTEELYRPVFADLGVPATLSLNSGATVVNTLPNGTPLLALDKTQGIDISGGDVTLQTLKPVAELMMADVVALGLTRANFEKGIVTLNDKVWNITATQLNPTSFGQNDGLLFLILEGDSDD